MTDKLLAITKRLRDLHTDDPRVYVLPDDAYTESGAI